MRRLPQTLLIVLVAALAGLAGYWTNRHGGVILPLGEPTAGAGTVAPEAGERLLALRLPDADGAWHELSALRGQVVVVNFWATWCPPCREEIPDFVELAERFRDQGVRFVGLSIDTPANVARFRDEMAVSYPLLIGNADTLNMVGSLGNPAQGLPFTLILDRDGMIRHIKLGRLSKSDLEGKIRALAS